MTNSSSRVIKLKKSVSYVSNVTERVIDSLNDPEVKKVIDEKIAHVRDKAYKEGYQKGADEARKAEIANYSGATVLVNKSIEELNKYLERLYKEIEEEVVHLVIAISEVIIRRELSCPDKVSNVIRESLKELSDKRGIIIRLHPTAGKYFDQIVEVLKKQGIELSQVRVILDQSIGEGGCYVETDTSVVDARIDKIFSEVRQKLEEFIKWELPAGKQQ